MATAPLVEALQNHRHTYRLACNPRYLLSALGCTTSRMRGQNLPAPTPNRAAYVSKYHEHCHSLLRSSGGPEPYTYNTSVPDLLDQSDSSGCFLHIHRSSFLRQKSEDLHA